MKLFDQTSDIEILVPAGAEEPILLAAADLQSNLRRLSGKTDGFPIVTTWSGASAIWIETKFSGEIEAYTVAVEAEQVRIVGSDTLGTVYGIYAFATRCLGILPVYRLVDRFPEAREEWCIEPQRFSSAERTVRFRGWFLNDEDLLTDWKLSGGHRKIDYPFYQNVMDTAVLDTVLETALRLEINLVIPSSFVDIDNPAEEELVQTVCRRGMYVSQHHVEPMGVSYFGADNYIKSRGYENETVSFINNRERMEEIWRYYAEKWAKYQNRVVWQLGLRGKGDKAVWQNDPSVPISMEERGAIITDAIKTQYDMIRKTLGTDSFYSTATLWNEGSELYGKGFLKLPDSTIPIFSDFGLDQMFGDDFYTADRETTRKYGIYYHAGFWTLGPHLTEGCNPEKMAYCYRDAAEHNNLYYSILNISNVRPLHLSAMMNARILRSPLSFNAADELLKLDRELFGEAGERVNEIRREYYTAFANFGNEPLKEAANAWHFYYREYEDLPFIRNAATDGQLVWFGKFMLQEKKYPKLPEPNDETLARLKESAERFGRLYQKAGEAEALLSEAERMYFRQFLKYQIRHMQLLTEWCVACKGLMDTSLSGEERKTQGAVACSKLEEILVERKILEQGEWKDWHRGEKKVDITNLLKMTADVCKEIDA